MKMCEFERERKGSIVKREKLKKITLKSQQMPLCQPWLERGVRSGGPGAAVGVRGSRAARGTPGKVLQRGVRGSSTTPPGIQDI